MDAPNGGHGKGWDPGVDGDRAQRDSLGHGDSISSFLSGARTNIREAGRHETGTLFFPCSREHPFGDSGDSDDSGTSPGESAKAGGTPSVLPDRAACRARRSGAQRGGTLQHGAAQRSAAQPGQAQLSAARRGAARGGGAQRGTARRSMARPLHRTARGSTRRRRRSRAGAPHAGGRRHERLAFCGSPHVRSPTGRPRPLLIGACALPIAVLMPVLAPAIGRAARETFPQWHH
eukprot:gene12648-biopygen7769